MECQSIFVKIEGPFGNVILVTLFKCCENTCGGKTVVEIHIVLFKQKKLLYKQRYQIASEYFIIVTPFFYGPCKILSLVKIES